MKKDFVNPRYAKSDDYRAVLEEIKKEGKCPFCPENFRWHPKPTIFECGKWFLTEVGWKYENAAHHLLLIGKTHKENFWELSPNDLKEVGELVELACVQFKIQGGAVALRFGDTKYTGATVKHLHFHLIVPEKGKVVNFPIG
ncbi:MAG: hypothetical protein UW81_C0004G0080 [Candidatus Giovannonibacteria bacterium GW2011_GWC2_44_9]|uniref:HIT domain-containing protein n=3 Tax=Candidatus Giovannoniibacteriota TaxID=1752738 RepID=A0A0G1LXA1_9BACT|nr:MAG: hypothetical protein UW49_C0001G0090 [Candidatus Giovannonibacteria bacterium GW2011_GWB1_44_23]KKT64364.1 MAG: hypothetical protein UW57_C0001G0091 [Candidatus Giovannonibacteria bacterium GW2011_GWA1_44_29]KKT84319.1 MAG: hypothetical protein UW81_C0004G0080 [Candidatus Giovannonibacteria bacterium GW2011_GWC2_44_9]KKT92091.1 MAG: histidine triad [Parcubacteria group bacterium GW2011_GWC1_45_13]